MGVRRHLREHHGVAQQGFPYLGHDEYLRPICEYLRTEHRTLWLSDAAREQRITLMVYDRHNRRRLEGGGELPKTNPVSSPPDDAPVEKATLIHLYCQTHDDGQGWHYEWIQTSCARWSPAARLSASVAWVGHVCAYTSRRCPAFDCLSDCPLAWVKEGCAYTSHLRLDIDRQTHTWTILK